MIHFIDIETTGLNPAYHEMIEFGMVTLDPTTYEAFDTEFSLPFDPERADPKALEVNGFGARDFAPLISPEEAATLLDASILRSDFVVAWHSHFDFGFLNQFYHRVGGRTPWSHSNVLDMPSLVLARRGIIQPGRTATLMPLTGVLEGDDKHTALADARACYECWKALDLWVQPA